MSLSFWINRKKARIILITFNLVFFIALSSLLFSSQQSSENFQNDIDSASMESLRTQILPKENYTSILDEPKNHLGQVTVTGLSFDETGFDFLSDPTGEPYGDLTDDIEDGALNLTFHQMKFMGTTDPAEFNNLNPNSVKDSTITVLLNETVKVDYNRTIEVSEKVETYLVYGPRLYPCLLKDFYVRENNTDIVIDVGERNYTVDDYNFLVFQYHDYFSKEKASFDMYLIWEYNLTLEDWDLEQIENTDIFVNDKHSNISVDYDYHLELVATKYENNITGTYPFLDSVILADNLDVNLRIDLPEKEKLNNYILKIDNTTISNDNIKNHLLSDNKTISTNLNGAEQKLSLRFTTSFIFLFRDAVEKHWAIDRLFSNKSTRERIYFPSIIAGPSKLYVQNIRFYELTISINQVSKKSSLFGRTVSIWDANVSTVQKEIKNSLIFTENVTRKKGLEVQVPFLIKGETCPFSFKYKANEDLNIQVADNINMPLAGLFIKIYYNGVRYGTFISLNISQPHAPLTTDENGRVLVENVPNGNYTIEIYQGSQVISNTTLSSYATLNFVYLQDIVHFPIWILIFSIFNGILIILGTIYYLNQKKLQTREK